MRPIHRKIAALLVVACAFAAGCTNKAAAGQAQQVASTTRPAAKPATRPIWTGNYHLHLPGISGIRGIDRSLMRGLNESGLDAKIESYDWTTADPGLGSLLAHRRAMDESDNVGQIILEHYRANPAARITITAHSGGGAIITWALEKLPDDVMVDSIVLLAPALSPTYDLSRALKHVRGHVYVFYSEYDAVVLGAGTSLFGTMDGVKTEAAGKVGFQQPETADAGQYKKLVQFPYDRAWMKYDNTGEHIGTMNRAFAREVIVPTLLTGHLPATRPADHAAADVRRSAGSVNAAAGSK